VRKHWRRFILASCTALSLAACESPADRVPPGYADACWGGRDNSPRYVAFTDLRQTVTVDATEENWPLLKNIVKEAASEHGLQIFDTSESGPHLRMVMVTACHASGITVMLDKRIFVGHPEAEPEFLRGKVQVTLYTYKPGADFEPVARALEQKLRAASKEHAVVERFPARLPAQKALPDTVAALLRRECSAATEPKPDYCTGF
jgi:hypothetical protein